MYLYIYICIYIYVFIYMYVSRAPQRGAKGAIWPWPPDLVGLIRSLITTIEYQVQ